MRLSFIDETAVKQLKMLYDLILLFDSNPNAEKLE